MKPFLILIFVDLEQDIPSIVAEAAKKHHNVPYLVTAPIGLHELMVVSYLSFAGWLFRTVCAQWEQSTCIRLKVHGNVQPATKKRISKPTSRSHLWHVSWLYLRGECFLATLILTCLCLQTVINDRMEYCLSQVAGEVSECDMCDGTGRCQQSG